MTKTEMEQAIRNLDRRLVNVEQILPTLATKDDVREAVRDGVRQAVQDALAEARRHTDVRIEALRDDIRIVAEAVAAIPAQFNQVNARIDRLARATDLRFARTDSRLDRMDERFDRIDERFDRIDERIDRMDQRFERMDERFDRLEGIVESTSKHLATLTDRLEAKGVI